MSTLLFHFFKHSLLCFVMCCGNETTELLLYVSHMQFRSGNTCFLTSLRHNLSSFHASPFQFNLFGLSNASINGWMESDDEFRSRDNAKILCCVLLRTCQMGCKFPISLNFLSISEFSY